MIMPQYMDLPEAAQYLHASERAIEEGLIENKLRAGVFSKAWQGRWWPEVNGERAHWSAKDVPLPDGRPVWIYSFPSYPYSVYLPEPQFTAQFWYVDHSHLYELLAMEHEPAEIRFIYREEIPEDADWRTRKGIMILHDTQDESRGITRANLRIPRGDLDRWAGTVSTAESSEMPLEFNGHQPEYLSSDLAIANRAAKEFWSTADRGNRPTYPTNSEVVDWLHKKGFSNRRAKAVATLIRPRWADPSK